jgi:hypothetical protein
MALEFECATSFKFMKYNSFPLWKSCFVVSCLPGLLQNIFENKEVRMKKCLEQNGGHFQLSLLLF